MTEIDINRLVRLDDRVAIVTGASSGLGNRFARVLHAAGATVVLAARRADRIDQLAGELTGSVPVVCDVTDDDQRRHLVEVALGLDGRIDILVNNAGVSNPMPAEDEPLDHFEAVMNLNVNSLFAMCQLVGRHMIDRGNGVIVNVASILGMVASAPVKQASYTASKGAVVNLTRELGAQWARKGVRVNALAPGWFPSELTSEMFDDEASLAFLRRNAPMGRGGDEAELDGALVFLAGDASTYMTGAVLVIDGGWTAR